MGLPFAKKSLGQHWLTDRASLEAMCDAARAQAGDTVLEIGPGTGTLTEFLLERGAHVVAIEKDEGLAAQLVSTFQGSDIHVQTGDILSFDFTGLPAGYKIVANIPYYLTSNLVRVLSETVNPPAVAVLLVQKEVAERVAAGAGRMSILSVTAQYYWNVRLDREVPSELFTPPPKVDSQILILSHRSEPLFPNADTTRFFHLIKAGFSQRRKTLLNSLSGGLRMSRDETAELLAQAGIDPSVRAQMLSLNDWYRLYLVFTALPA